ncbi:PQQ-dependent sugar dehydrogenase [Prosthecobacter sp.]|uniref:PQQ-dependent sugar dehydrogenase n=1 Tax=Prosthecobacter sp. TaxID=1965333 RepID=UPI001D2D645B|nr:PQQ-dependent sugar dehydrogenase [Prosthecobacter sp.]MCB1276306.1 PQQ-dependent sugar dehydrogenase [Prosthecobacter sp.]
MKRVAVLAFLFCGSLANAQTPKVKKPVFVPEPLPPLAYALEDALGGLTFSMPVAVVNVPGDESRVFVVEKTGRIQVTSGLDQTTPQKQLFADLTQPSDGKLDDKGECGLLGMACHPDFARNGRFFVCYSLRIDGQLHQRVSRFDGQKEQPLITQCDPASNHNGGDLHFGPDGYLYISVGDGGGQMDAFNNARFINKDFQAAILRLDVDKKSGSLPPNPHPAIARDANGEAFYAVPADNPFVGATLHHGEKIDPATVRTEIWATGLRNVWRFSFNPPTGRLFAGDVGQNLYEEVDLIIKGGDYGWSHREGLHAFDLGPGKDTPPSDFHPIDPIFEYPHTTGLSITGGRVCHGTKFPELEDAYICADYAFGRVIAAREKEGRWETQIIAFEPAITGIGVDPRDGELLFCNMAKGRVMRLVKTEPKLEGVLFSEGFDDAQADSRGWYDGKDVRIVPEGRHGNCIEYEWIDGSGVTGSSAKRHLFEPADEIFIRYYLKLSKGWGWSGRSYHPHLTHFMTTENTKWHGPAASHLTLYIEPVNGKLRLAAQDIQNKDAPHGLTQGPLKGGYNGQMFDSADELFTDDAWHCIEAQFKLNTLDLANDKPNADGIVRGWVDGKLVIDHANIILRSTDFPNMKFNQFLMAPYFGPGLLPHAQKLWIDEMVVGTKRIGPLHAERTSR